MPNPSVSLSLRQAFRTCFPLAVCLNRGMTPKEHLISRLVALCNSHGGPEAVAAEAGVSAESLKQVIAGTKLPSGEPRGIGPKVQRSLNLVYPGWAGLPDQPDLVVPDSSGEAVVIELKGVSLDDTTLSVDELQDLLAAAVDLPVTKARELLAHVMLDAEGYRQSAQRALRRFGVTGVVTNERTAETLPSASSLPPSALGIPIISAKSTGSRHVGGGLAKIPGARKAPVKVPAVKRGAKK